MKSFILLLAQTEPLGGAIPGGAGWAGAGLLSGVLAWLLGVHLPAKDKQLMALIESRDGLVKGLAADYRQSFTDLTVRFSEIDRERRADYKASLEKFAEMTATIISLQHTISEQSAKLKEL